MYRTIAICLCLIVVPVMAERPAKNAGDAAAKIDFNRDIRPLLSSNCFSCHGPDPEARATDLRLDTQKGAQADLGGYAAIVPKDPDASEMLSRLMSDDEDERMPPQGKGRRLTDKEVALVKRWIEEGGEYARHWSYSKPTRPDVPKVDGEIRNPIDAFVVRRLDKEGLKPSPAADRYTLARRVAIDLTGLPPSVEEANAFVEDKRPDAYERYVDAQLSKTAYGERWARVWLDLARYADSGGYASDVPRTIWAYRDWVIRSLNDNMPFDQFTIEQLAGDLLDQPTQQQVVATAFHRNTMTNTEGGTNDEEFRNAAVVDRVNTTMEVWMGTTAACAQCHTHKFDPITQAEYFQLFDFFNQSEDTDRGDEKPTISLFTDPQQKTRKAELESQLARLENELKKETPQVAASRDVWLEQVQQPLEWKQLVTQKATSTDGADLKTDGDWIKLANGDPDRATYELEIPTEAGWMSALQLEVAPEQSGNFVLSQVRATWIPRQASPISGRFVRISLPGDGKMIHIAELQAFSNGKNVAYDAAVKQSSTGFGGPAERAVDGETDGEYAKGSVTHTEVSKDPWIEVDLGSEQALDEIKIWNRTDSNLESRLKGYEVSVLDAQREVVWQRKPDDVPEPSTTHSLSGTQVIEFVSASADYEQGGFPASSVIAAQLDEKKGWAIGGREGKPHELNLILARPLELAAGTLRVILEQQSIHKQHTLNRFRLRASDDENADAIAKLPANIRNLVQKKDRNEQQEKSVREFYRTIAPELADQREAIAKLKKQVGDIKPTTSVPVMKDLAADKQRVTKIQVRGNYKNQTDVVQRATPAVFHAMDEDQPKNRLGLAQWLVDADNPLTARVMVNRFWEQMFGIGLVSTNEEFGSQGEPPTHPELLDWLAVEFQSDWDIKRLLKAMVMSSTYRQSSKTTPELLEIDPFNRLYARGPRFRISAEMVRDQALAVGGLLSRKMYGQPVKPPQPNSGLNAAFGSSTDWKTSGGEDKYRRGLYTTWRRSSPYPSMATFDAPTREVCTSRRSRTNTPLQALVTLNDPVYVEAAQALARRMDAEGGESIASKVAFGFMASLIREPTEPELTELVKLFERTRALYADRPEQAAKMAEEPLGKAPEGADVADLAAWTVVGNVILNLDEMFLKR